MNECRKHQWYTPSGTWVEVLPPCPWCQIKTAKERIALLEKVAEAANNINLDCEEVENADGMIMLVPIDVMHELSDSLDALRAAGYLEEGK